MPQMYPLNWIILFFFFISIFILFNIMNYFIYLNKNNILDKKMLMKKSNFTWKW